MTRAPQAVGAFDILLVQTALQSGASPEQALGVIGERVPDAATVRRRVLAGDSLGEVAATSSCGAHVAPLVRTLAVAEAVGASSGPALDSLVRGLLARQQLQRLIRIRSADARLTATILLLLPLLGTGVSVLFSAGARSFYAAPPGWAIGSVAALLMGLAVLWIRRLLRGVAAAAGCSDPLSQLPSVDSSVLPTAEAVDLMALALSAGLPVAAATDLVARLGPPAVRAPLAAVAQGLAAGATPAHAFPAALRDVSEVMAVSARWGAPAAPGLRLLSAELHARSLAAAEEAAERLGSVLVFPTTLLLVPAFALLVVPPLVASAFRGASLGL